MCIEASQPPVIFLHIQEEVVHEHQPLKGFEHIMSILENLPEVRNLELHFRDETPDDGLEPPEFDQLLMPLIPENEPEFCPKLQDVTVVHVILSGATPVLLIRLLEARVAGGSGKFARLSSLRIFGYDDGSLTVQDPVCSGARGWQS